MPAFALEYKLESIDEKIGRLITRGRTHVGLTLEDAAVEIGISAADMLKMERGESRPQPEQLIAMAELFRVTPSWFFPTAGDMESSRPESLIGSGKIELIVQQVRVLIGRDFDDVTLRRVLMVLKG